MKIVKKIMAFLLVITAVMNIAATPVNAATYIGSKDRKEGGVLGIGATTYTYRVYYDNNTIRYWHGKPLSYVPYHTKGSGNELLLVSKSQSISFSSTVSYNSSVGGTIGFEGLVSLASSKGYGVTIGVSFTSTSVKSYTKTISSSAKTGYYMLAPSQTEKKCHWNKYKNNNTVNTGKSGTFFMPYGTSTVCCLYSANNSSWGIYR